MKTFRSKHGYAMKLSMVNPMHRLAEWLLRRYLNRQHYGLRIKYSGPDYCNPGDYSKRGRYGSVKRVHATHSRIYIDATTKMKQRDEWRQEAYRDSRRLRLQLEDQRTIITTQRERIEQLDNEQTLTAAKLDNLSVLHANQARVIEQFQRDNELLSSTCSTHQQTIESLCDQLVETRQSLENCREILNDGRATLELHS